MNFVESITHGIDHNPELYLDESNENYEKCF